MNEREKIIFTVGIVLGRYENPIECTIIFGKILRFLKLNDRLGTEILEESTKEVMDIVDFIRKNDNRDELR